jgi:hypothetical protein
MIDHRDLTINGTDYTLSVLPDPETEPEGQNADREAILAWRRGQWRYVGVVLKRDRDNAEASLWGVEYGQLPHDVTITTDNLVNDEYMSSVNHATGVTTTVTLVGALAEQLECTATT